MEKRNYNACIIVNASEEKAFECINNVADWWNDNLIGDSHQFNGVFTINYNEKGFTTHKIVEFEPNIKVVWLVTDCFLDWLKDKKEWQDTKISFEISRANNKTQINFTHIGLTPEVECYEMCVKGWDQYIKGSLFKLINEGIGEPRKKN